MYEIVYVSIISGVFGIIGLLIYQSGALRNWALRMDYKKQEYDHKEKIEKMRAEKKLTLEQMKMTNPQQTGNLLGELGNIDADQVSDLIDNIKGIGEATGEEGVILKLLNNPIIRGLAKGYLKKKSEKPENEAKFE